MKPIYPNEIFEKKLQENLSYMTGIFNDLNYNKFLHPVNEVKFLHNLFKKDGNYYYSDKIFPLEVTDYDQGSFKYKLNKNSFRCKNFSEFDVNKTNILIGGCSISLGVGLPEDVLWQNKIINKLGWDKNSLDIYNLSINGGCISVVMRNIFTFIKNVGIPNYIFLNLPQSSRGLQWNSFQNKFVIVHYEPAYLQGIPHRMREEDKRADLDMLKYIEEYSHEMVLFNTLFQIHMLELLCKAYNINLLWTSWEGHDSDFYNQLEFNNFFYNSISISDNSVVAEEFNKFWWPDDTTYGERMKDKRNEIMHYNINNEPYWDIARDGQHPGGFYHDQVAQSFVDTIKKRKMI